MRLCFSNFDAPDNPWYGGGGAAAIHEVARRLATRGWETRVITGRFPGAQNRVIDQVRYERVGAGWLGPKAGQLLFPCALMARVRRGDFDLWVESLTPPFSTACLQRFTPKPVVALTQVMAGRAMFRQYGLPFHVLERFGLRTYRYAIATSGYLESEIRAAHPTIAVEVIPNGAAPELVRLAPAPPGTHHLLFLGRLARHQKGLDLLLEAWAAVKDRIPAPLVIAGAGLPGEEAWLRHRIETLGPSSKVRWTGKAVGTDKDALLRQAMFLVMPSRFEASPLVAAEAFCYGLPVVTFDLPELRDLPREGCLKVSPFAVDDLGRALVTLAQDPARRQVMGSAAKAFARQLDWDLLASRYDAFLRSILGPETRTNPASGRPERIE
jgi:glycosyltransferase involved in cell wall biosynthesis